MLVFLPFYFKIKVELIERRRDELWKIILLTGLLPLSLPWL